MSKKEQLWIAVMTQNEAIFNFVADALKERLKIPWRIWPAIHWQIMWMLQCFEGLPDKLPDLIIAFFPEDKHWQLLSRYIQAIKTTCPDMPIIILSQAPAESKYFQELAEVADQVVEFPPDPKELVAITKKLLAANEKVRQPKSDAEIEAELIRQGWRKEIREGCEVFVRPMEEET